MKKIVPILLLLVGVVTPTYAEKDVADRAIRCSALIYIELTRPEMAGLTAGEALMNRVYAYHMIDDNEDMEMTNGQITEAQTDAITKLTQEYIQGANLAEEYRGCIYWMTDVAKFINISEYVATENSSEESDAAEMELFLSAPTETSVTSFKNPIKTWEQQVDLGFVAWASQELEVPYKEAILLKVSEKFE
jgi:hypothetical protein